VCTQTAYTCACLQPVPTSLWYCLSSQFLHTVQYGGKFCSFLHHVTGQHNAGPEVLPELRHLVHLLPSPVIGARSQLWSCGVSGGSGAGLCRLASTDCSTAIITCHPGCYRKAHIVQRTNWAVFPPPQCPTLLQEDRYCPEDQLVCLTPTTIPHAPTGR
jgi:hypothetical protein